MILQYQCRKRIDRYDFYEKANHCKVLGRQEEIECACQMKSGDVSARERLI